MLLCKFRNNFPIARRKLRNVSLRAFSNGAIERVNKILLLSVHYMRATLIIKWIYFELFIELKLGFDLA